VIEMKIKMVLLSNRLSQDDELLSVSLLLLNK